MNGIEQALIDLLLLVFSADDINRFMQDTRAIAVTVGALVAASGGLLGVFLMLRRMAMTTDAISHTVLLGIVIGFFIVGDINSPWLIAGAALSGVATVVLTEMLFRSGLVKADAALGLAFPFLFAVAVVLISRYVDDVHLDTDAVYVGQIGAPYTTSYCLDGCDPVVITPEDPRARVGRDCINCTPGADGINPFSPEAVFEETCANCGTYSASEAWAARLIPQRPTLVYWPRSLTVMGVILLANLLFVTLFYKELKLATFDAALARALGLRPGVLHYALMALVSTTAVGAFDAAGSILVVAFFVIPAATAYLLSDRLGLLLLLAPSIGAAGAAAGYEFARGQLFGLIDMDALLRALDGPLDLRGGTSWNTSIAAAMVIVMLLFFLAAWVISPRYGLVAAMIRRRRQRRRFADQVVLGHIYNHQGTMTATHELAQATLYQHFDWPEAHMRLVLRRLRAERLIEADNGCLRLTQRGVERVTRFRQGVGVPS